MNAFLLCLIRFKRCCLYSIALYDCRPESSNTPSFSAALQQNLASVFVLPRHNFKVQSTRNCFLSTTQAGKFRIVLQMFVRVTFHVDFRAGSPSSTAAALSWFYARSLENLRKNSVLRILTAWTISSFSNTIALRQCKQRKPGELKHTISFVLIKIHSWNASVNSPGRGMASTAMLAVHDCSRSSQAGLGCLCVVKGFQCMKHLSRGGRLLVCAAA